jgi:hypothetical protein
MFERSWQAFYYSKDPKLSSTYVNVVEKKIREILRRSYARRLKRKAFLITIAKNASRCEIYGSDRSAFHKCHRFGN